MAPEVTDAPESKACKQQHLWFGYTSLTTHCNPEDGGSTASETLIYIYHTTRRKNSENHLYKMAYLPLNVQALVRW